MRPPPVRHGVTWTVDDDVVLPDVVVGLDGVERVVERDTVAVSTSYLDTGDLDLLRHGVTVRNRHGDDQPGWSVQVGDTPSRAVLPFAERSVRVPRSVARVLVGARCGRPLTTAARTHTLRDVQVLLSPGGDPVLTVSDDRVEATGRRGPRSPVRWRTVDVTLGPAGDDAVLAVVSRSLLRAGARPSTAASDLQRLVQARTGHHAPGAEPVGARELLIEAVGAARATLVQGDVLLRAGFDGVRPTAEAVDRLDDLLHLGRDLLHLGTVRSLSDQLRWFAAVLREVDGPESARRRWAALAATAGEDHRTGRDAPALQHAAALLDTLAVDGAERGAAALQRVLVGTRHRALLGALHDLEAEPPWTTDTAPVAVTLAWRDAALDDVVVALDRVALDDAGPHATAALARAVRRARTAAQLAHRSDPRPGPVAVLAPGDEDLLARSADLVGRLEDARADVVALRTAAGRIREADVGFVVGGFHERVRRRAAVAREGLLALAAGR